MPNSGKPGFGATGWVDAAQLWPCAMTPPCPPPKSGEGSDTFAHASPVRARRRVAVEMAARRSLAAPVPLPAPQPRRRPVAVTLTVAVVMTASMPRAPRRPAVMVAALIAITAIFRSPPVGLCRGNAGERGGEARDGERGQHGFAQHL